MTAESVDGVGDGARWFHDGGGLGILSVGVAIDEAAVIYRIHVGISDLDADARLDMATGLALTALPRFPGVTVEEEPEPEVEPLSVVVTPDDVVTDDHSYLGHLLAGQTACVSYDKTGQGDVTASWRQGDPGISPGLIVLDADWTSDLPDELEDRSVLVVTSIRGNVSPVLTVEKLTDEDCEDEDDSDEQEGSIFGEAGAGTTPSDCLEFCDPSAYYWGPMTFNVVGA